MSKFNRLTRVVQIMWLVIAAVCVVEVTILYSNPQKDQQSAYLFTAVAVFAIFRFIMLRRQQLKKEGKL